MADFRDLIRQESCLPGEYERREAEKTIRKEASEVVEKIKEGILFKASRGDYKLVDGKRYIVFEFGLSRDSEGRLWVERFYDSDRAGYFDSDYYLEDRSGMSGDEKRKLFWDIVKENLKADGIKVTACYAVYRKVTEETTFLDTILGRVKYPQFVFEGYSYADSSTTGRVYRKFYRCEFWD